MGYVVKEADIHKEKDILLSLLVSNRERENYPYEKRHDWLYYQNPYGAATAWIIWDENNNVPAGFTAVYPRKMLVQGKEYVCWNCGDFSIEKKYRTLGIALKLRKEAKKNVDEGRIPFLYAHPNNRMRHIHLKAGHVQIAWVKRFALPLKVSNYLGERKAARVISSVVADPIVRGMLKFKFKKTGDYEVQNQETMQFGPEYREICEEVNTGIPVVGLRDETYLTWKFKNHPVVDYQLFNYYENGRLFGYIFFYDFKGTIHVTEFFCRGGASSRRNLLSSFINYLVNENPAAYSISTVIQEYNPFVPILEEAGFKFRDDATSAAIAYSAHPELKEIIHKGENWFLTSGDRDA